LPFGDSKFVFNVSLSAEQKADSIHSAHIDGMESEFIVRSGHPSQLQPLAIDEVRRISGLSRGTVRQKATANLLKKQSPQNANDKPTKSDT